MSRCDVCGVNSCTECPVKEERILQMSSTEYQEIYGSLAEESKAAMAELFDQGINHSGVWVRYGAAEKAVVKIIKAERAKIYKEQKNE